MKERCGAGDLPDIDSVSGLGNDVLLRDDMIGHGGPMMLDLSGLVWLSTTYGADIDRAPAETPCSDTIPAGTDAAHPKGIRSYAARR